MSINVNREVKDSFYRYKMPPLTAKVEGKGNGIKTVIVNMVEIAKALYRKPIYPTKYFGCELGAQIYVDEKNERYIVNGSHGSQKLQELLDGFIKRFVLCQNCGNPETTLSVRKKAGTVVTKCKACGHVQQLDATHRLTQFIIKNPPDTEDDGASKVAAAKGKGKRGKNGNDSPTEEGEGNAEGNGGPAENEDSGVGPSVGGGGFSNADERDGAAEDDDWAEETTEEARLRRMNELTSAAKSLALTNDLEKTDGERADMFYAYLKNLHKQGKVVEKRQDIKLEAERLLLSERVVMILMEVLLDKPASLLTDIEKYKLLFISFTRKAENPKRAQRHALGGMEKIVEKFIADNLVSKSCHLVKKMYDCDILEEDAIIDWHDKGPSKRYIPKELSRKILESCAPMVKWLKEAEEESEEEDDEDVVIEETNNKVNGKGVANHGPHLREENGVGKAGHESGEEEIDIDAI